MTSVDLRRFDYALEPLRQQRTWRLERLQSRLAQLQARLARSEAVVAQARHQLQCQSEALVQSPGRQVDPATHTRSLQWLVVMRQRVVELEAQLELLRADRTRLHAQCQEQQRQIEAIDAHRADCQDAFVLQESGRLATEADRDWLVRAAFLRQEDDVAREVPR